MSIMHVHDEHHQHDHQGHEGDEPHSHPHQHDAIEHSHEFMIDLHHPFWPTGQSTQTGQSLSGSGERALQQEEGEHGHGCSYDQNEE